MKLFKKSLWLALGGVFVLLTGCAVSDDTVMPSDPADDKPAVVKSEEAPAEDTLADMCYEARRGDKKAQYMVGRYYNSELKTLGKMKSSPQSLRRRTHYIAVALFWLDGAIKKGTGEYLPEAKILRQNLGTQAGKAEFDLYAQLSHMGMDAPCDKHEVDSPFLGMRAL